MGQYNEVCRFRSCNATVILSSGTSEDDLHDAMLVMRDGSVYINVNGELMHMQSFITNARPPRARGGGSNGQTGASTVPTGSTTP